ncbi:hypothetical protein [Chenggangzhangella methanolivorans]|uniref:Uncharacterized protein n=1 Tax=Chenggangzhangella methanolivorans TaxID=1437009 RepID=A0A9E6RK82_9HYPH|nr:hypothetical protein [Chenggangzhangella methanolivorans]QZO02572.1 hypothetical protein K6K41_07475 [Chenggangzhangella methanolivorans]
MDKDEPELLSPSLGGRPLDLSEAGPERAAGKWFEVDGADGSELYVVERPLSVGPPKAQRRLMLAVALDHAQVADARRAFVWDMVVVLALISLVLLAAGPAVPGDPSAARPAAARARRDPGRPSVAVSRGRPR